jgi:hypothetical protein
VLRMAITKWGPISSKYIGSAPKPENWTKKWRHIFRVVTHFVTSHFSWRHTFLDVTLFVTSHFSWRHTFRGVTFSVASHFLCRHIFRGVTLFVASHFTWRHTFRGVILYVEYIGIKLSNKMLAYTKVSSR